MSVCVVMRCVEEAILMRAFGLRISGSMEGELAFWIALPEAAEEACLVKPQGLAVAKVRNFSGVDRRRQVLDPAKKEWPILLVVGKQAGVESEDLNLRFSTDIFEKVAC